MPETIYLSKIAYGVSSILFPGQKESGDLYSIKELPEEVMIGVVDGMGHGQEAALAAKSAVTTLESTTDLSVIRLVKLCHEKLKSTRGAVMTLATINYIEETLTWLSVGNVEGVLIRADSEAKPAYESIFICPGVVGYHLPQLVAKVLPIAKGDLLILSTDGIRNDYASRITAEIHYAQRQLAGSGEHNKDKGFSESLTDLFEPFFTGSHINIDDLTLAQKGQKVISPFKVAKYITNHFMKGSDDALVAVVKYLGKR